MKLLQELLLLREEEEEQKPSDKETDLKQKLQDMFKEADSGGQLQAYVKIETLQAKDATAGEEVHVNFPGEPAHNAVAKQTDMLVRDSENPNAIKLVPKNEFENDYEPEKDDSHPDAEGFVSYRPKGQVLAFQYNEHEPLQLKDEHGHTVHVKYGDYLGYPIDDATTLIQLDKSHFEKAYRLAE